MQLSLKKQDNILDFKSMQNEKYYQATDDELVISIQKNNDHDAFNHLVKKYSKRLFYLVLSFVKDEEAAWDILQDSFLKIYKTIPNFKKNSSIITWFSKIAVNTSIDYLRKEKRSKISNNKSIEDLSQNQMAEYIINKCEPEDMFFKEYTRLEVSKAINNLSSENRLLLHLKYFEDFSINEIAEVINTSAGNVKSKLFYARKELKSSIEHLL